MQTIHDFNVGGITLTTLSTYNHTYIHTYTYTYSLSLYIEIGEHDINVLIAHTQNT